MQWVFVDSQRDLDMLDKSVCWEDSSCIEFYATSVNDLYFPAELNGSGCGFNIHAILGICSEPTRYLELVCIHCDHYTSRFLSSPFIKGHVDSLKRITIVDAWNDIQMRCDRLIYRFMNPKEVCFLSDRLAPEGLFLKTKSKFD
jgi:hypothetical protein